MKVVIEIPDNYKDMLGYSNENIDVILRAVKNGTPLPEGHGKLIAEPTEEDIAKTVGGQNDFAECIRDAVKAVFDNAPTIIEADTEGSEENDDRRNH